MLDEEKESMEKTIRHTTVCAMLHDFLITEHDKGSAAFSKEDAHASDADVDNELSCPVNDATEETE